MLISHKILIALIAACATLGAAVITILPDLRETTAQPAITATPEPVPGGSQIITGNTAPVAAIGESSPGNTIKINE